MASERLVVVGHGMAALRLIEELTETAADRFAITLVGAERQPAYNRVLLSSLLAGEIAAADVEMRPREWYVERGIALRTGLPAVSLDTATRAVGLSDGGVVPYDRLVLATGAEPIRLGMPGSTLTGVATFRSLADVDELAAAAGSGRPVVVIGGGLLGIEAAYGLARKGAAVTLVHLVDRLMERQLDAEGAALLKGALEAKGIRVLLGTQTRAIRGNTAVEAIELGNGQRLACGLVVMAVGVRAHIALAQAGGLVTQRGVCVDDHRRLRRAPWHLLRLGRAGLRAGACSRRQSVRQARHIPGLRARD
jgi:nitrite reductase (NADH) large subunit